MIPKLVHAQCIISTMMMMMMNATKAAQQLPAAKGEGLVLGLLLIVRF